MTDTTKKPAPAKPGAASKMLSMKEAAALLGLEGTEPHKAVRRLLEAQERELKRPVLLRYGGQGKGARYKVALAVLKDLFPARWSRAEEYSALVIEALASRDERIAALEEQVALLRSFVREMGRAMRAAGLLEPAVRAA
jgi:hypothetical protein